MQNNAYVYVIFDLDGIPRYVGKGKGPRWRVHTKRSTHSPLLAKIIEAAGQKLPVVKIRTVLSDAEAFETEIAFIKVIGRKGYGGPLVNLTDGGDGVQYCSPEIRAKISAAKKGHKMSAEARANMRAGHLGTRHSLEHRKAISAGNKGKKFTKEHREALSKVDRSYFKGPITEGRRANIRAALLAFWNDRRRQGLPLRHARAKEPAR